VILHLKFTARESGGLFKENAIAYIQNFLMNTADLTDQPLMRAFSMKHEFSTQWHMFLHPASEDGEQVLRFTLGKEQFPFFTQARDIVVMKIEAFARCIPEDDYSMVLSLTNRDQETITSSEFPMPTNGNYGGLKKGTLGVNDFGLNLDELDIEGPMSLRMRQRDVLDFKSLATKPSEVEDLFLVVHYKLAH
jgi:hypothetical protein